MDPDFLSLIVILVIAAIFSATMIYTMVTVGQAVAKNDNKASVATTILNTSIINAVFIGVLGVTAYFYFNNSDLYDVYVMVMLHIALFMAILSSSISSLHQLNA
jgi:hypothetical protein